MKEYTYNDRIGSRSRRSYLWLRHQGKMYEFAGKTIPGIVSVIGTDYNKQGKWSSSTYRLALLDNVGIFDFHAGWETGTIREGLADGVPLDTWYQFANRLGVGLSEAQRFLREIAPKAADHYDQVENELMAMADEVEDINIITISFGAPTNRQIREGFWEAPVLVIDNNKKVVGRILREENDLYISYCDSATVVDQKHSRGYHGGWVEIKVALPDGWSLKHDT